MMTADVATALTGERMTSKYAADGPQGPSQQEIARLAYHIYEKRGRQDGKDLDDWLSAELELTRSASVREN